MDIPESRLDSIESQSIKDVSHGQNKQRYFSMEKISNSFRTIYSRVFFRSRGEAMLLEPVPEFLTNLKLSDLFDFPGEYVLMNAKMLSTVSDGNEEWLEKLRSHGTPLACLKNDQGDSILHLAAGWNHLELVKNIISECPCLLLELNSNDQLPIHVAARKGYLAIVNVLVASVTFFSSRLGEEDREVLNPYLLKDTNGDTPLKLSLKGGDKSVALHLVNENRQASFLASKDEISSLYLAVEFGYVSLVEKMLGNDGANFNLEGKKCLAHAALKSMNTDMLDVILERCSTLLDERDEKRRTCLSFGASMGYYEGVCKLLDRSTEGVFVRDDDGSYPIHNAIEKGHINIVKKILKRCPYSKHLLNKKCQNVLHIAADIGRFKILSYLMSMCRHLAVEQDEDGNTPLHLATMKWRPRAVRCLAGSTNMSIRNNENSTALDIAEAKRKPNYIFLETATLLALINAHGHNDPRCKHIMKGIKPITHKGDVNKDYINSLLVVAALIATVTFQAAFTIPGGTKDENPNVGMANLATGISGKRTKPESSYFLLFLTCEVMALLSSLVSASYLIVAQLGDPKLYDSSISMAMTSLFSSLYTMTLALFSAMMIIAGNATMISYLAYFIFPMVFFVVTAMYVVFMRLQGNCIVSRLEWEIFCFLIPIDDDGSYQLQVDEKTIMITSESQPST